MTSKPLWCSDMAEISDSSRTRSRGFPTLDLERCVEALRTAGKHALVHTRNAFASYLGHQTADSGPFKQKLASLKDFGLVETTSGVRLTDLGRRLAFPETAEDEQRDRQRAFLNSDVFKELYGDLGLGVEFDDDRLGAIAIRLGISTANRRTFADSFASSALYAGLATRPSPGKLVLDATIVATTAPSAGPATNGTSGDPSTVGTTQVPPDVTRLTDLVFTHDIGDGHVSLTVQMKRSMPASLFADLQKVAEAVELLAAKAAIDTVGDEPAAPDHRRDE